MLSNPDGKNSTAGLQAPMTKFNDTKESNEHNQTKLFANQT